MRPLTRHFLTPIALLCGLASSVAMADDAALLERARAIHEAVITIDTHVDINTANFTDERNYTSDLETQVTLPKMWEGGLDVAWFVVYTRQDEVSEAGYASALENAIDKFEAIHRLAEQYAPDQIEVAYTSEDVRRIHASGKLVAMIGVENAYPIGEDLSLIEDFHRRGARYMSLTHNGHNQLADSHTGAADGVWLHNGLSELGRQAIVEMNRLGIMIDLSHPSPQSNLQAIALSRAPVMASHSSAYGVSPVSRNLSDEELFAIRDNGGVAQTTAFRGFVDAQKHAAWRAAMEEFDGDEERARAVAPPVNVADYVDHIDYMVQLIGIDHVGISSDFDGGGGVDGWMDASETLNVTLELVRRGYSEEDIAKLWGENLLRVLDDVQRVAAEW